MGQCPLGELEHADGTLPGVVIGRDLHEALAIVLHEAGCGDIAVTNCLDLIGSSMGENSLRNPSVDCPEFSLIHQPCLDLIRRARLPLREERQCVDQSPA